MKVLVTGGMGFIGTHVVAELLAKNYDVAIIDYRCDRTDFSQMPGVSCYSVDISNSLDEVFEVERPDYVIHLAAQVDVNRSLEDPKLDASSNILGTINILLNSKKYNVKKIIYASSAAVYGEPIYLGIDELHPLEPVSFYGISKLSAEKYVKSFSKLHQLNYTILRYSNVYGLGSNQANDVISIFRNRLAVNKAPIIFGDGNQTRDYIYVKDVAAANVAAINQGNNEIFNISTNTPTKLNKLVKLLNVPLDKSIEPQHRNNRRGDISTSYLDNTKALNQLDWKINYPLETGLRYTLLREK